MNMQSNVDMILCVLHPFGCWMRCSVTASVLSNLDLFHRSIELNCSLCVVRQWVCDFLSFLIVFVREATLWPCPNPNQSQHCTCLHDRFSLLCPNHTLSVLYIFIWFAHNNLCFRLFVSSSCPCHPLHIHHTYITHNPHPHSTHHQVLDISEMASMMFVRRYQVVIQQQQVTSSNGGRGRGSYYNDNSNRWSSSGYGSYNYNKESRDTRFINVGQIGTHVRGKY